MDLNQMLIFERVCNTKSFTAAALELGLKKSNVSMKISALENRLGVKLLNRTTRTMNLTEAGHNFYNHCQEILEKIKEAEDQVRDLTVVPSGVLRVTMPMDFGLYCIEFFLKDFSEKNPGIIVELKLSHDIVNPNDPGVDLVIRPTVGSLGDSSLIVKNIFDSNLFLYASTEYLRGFNKKKNFEHLNDCEFIGFSPVGANSFSNVFFKESKSLFLQSKNMEKLQQKTKFVFSDMYACKEACKANLGVAVLPSWLVRDEVKYNEITALPKNLYHEKVTFFALYSTRKWLPRKTQLFLDALKDHCAKFS